MIPTPAETLAAYVRAFETLRAEDVVPFYLLPCAFIRPDGAWIVQDPPAALVLVNHMMEHAVAQGYRSTAITRLATRSLAPTLAELTGDFERYDAAGQPIGRFGFTYILREVSGHWKIVVAIAHDPASAPEPPQALSGNPGRDTPLS